jgi:Rps23 Pro-64 3,4-dihydroxylase Tpa1-like proline 4-hydroxylase
MSRLLGVRTLEFRMHWHYAPRGSSVSPHCDSKRKLGSHIFYFNTRDEWEPAWGGETLLLDDAGAFDRTSTPDFEDFFHATPSESLGNRSLIFSSSGNAWHGVREIRCPRGRMRKVFIIVLNQRRLRTRVRDSLRGRKIQRL